MIRRPVRQQHGTVLVTVLMMFAIATVIATEMAWRQKFDIRRTSAMLVTTQAREFLLAAESLALYALVDDYRQDKQKGGADASDNLTERWAKPVPPMPVDGGSVQGALSDAQGKFNVNWMVKAGPEPGKWVPNPEGIKAFANLLNALGVPKETTVSAQDLANRAADWMDSGDDPQPESGFEDTEYLRTEVPRRTPNAPIRDVTELRSIEGFDLETWRAIEPFVVALPPSTGLNPYTAPSEVLSAVGVQDTQTWIQKRLSVPLPALDELKRETSPQGQGNPSTPDATDPDSASGETGKGQGAGTTANGQIPFVRSSQYFELMSTARLGERTLYAVSILYRPPAGAQNDDRLKVIYRRFMDPLQPPPPMTMTTNGAPQ